MYYTKIKLEWPATIYIYIDSKEGLFKMIVFTIWVDNIDRLVSLELDRGRDVGIDWFVGALYHHTICYTKVESTKMTWNSDQHLYIINKALSQEKISCSLVLKLP